MFWRKFPKKLPKRDGWYLCTVEVQLRSGNTHRYVMNLYWYGAHNQFRDNTRERGLLDGRKDMYEEHKKRDLPGGGALKYKADDVIKVRGIPARVPLSAVNRTNEVIAWKPMPKAAVFKRIHDKVDVSKNAREQMGTEYDMSQFHPLIFNEDNKKQDLEMYHDTIKLGG